MEGEQKKDSVDIGLGMDIDQYQIDDIDDLQSPPNSPGLVLPGTVPSTNDKIDFFALDSSNDSIEPNKFVNDVKNIEMKFKPDNGVKTCTDPSSLATPSPSTSKKVNIQEIENGINKNDSKSKFKKKKISPGTIGKPPNNMLNNDNPIDSDNDNNVSNEYNYEDNTALNLNLNLTTSSDSYYSRSRKSFNIDTKQNLKTMNRRISDVSDKTDKSVRSDFYGSIGSSGSGSYDYDGSINGSFISDNDNDVYGSPILKHVNRKSKFSNNDITPIKSFNDNDNNITNSHFDDGIVYRALADISESIPSTPHSNSRPSSQSGSQPGSRSSSRSRSGSRQSKEIKDKDGDSSSMSQIFKNMLILEESLRQQYIQQQSLRYKYSLFLFIMIIIFSYSTYMSLIYPYNINLIDNNETFNKNYNNMNTITDNPKIEETLVDINFPTVSNMDQLNDETNILLVNNEKIYQNRKDKIKKQHDETVDENEDSDKTRHYNNTLNNNNHNFKNKILSITYKVCSIIMFMTLLLFYSTGEYTRKISTPRKFFVTANKGIRQLNIRLVKVKVSLKDRIIEYFNLNSKNKQHNVDHVRLVLNPRIFSTSTREQWELYRNQFWGLESVRNMNINMDAKMRMKMKMNNSNNNLNNSNSNNKRAILYVNKQEKKTK